MRQHCFGTVLAALVAACSSVGGDDTQVAAAHLEALCESLALPGEHHVTPRFSTCMLQCAAQAMLEMAKSAVSLKLNEGREGDEDEFCWMLRLRCQRGERLAKAFVLLNPEQPPAEGQLPPYRLLLTAPPSLRQHLRARRRGRRLLSTEACGARFDVTEPFRSAEGDRDAQMCVKAVCPEKDDCRTWRLGLRCPPFLATLWRSLPRPDS
ncbi:uncharacterized protein [Tiliqua scincoides]|uniref:uncharacterized protein n=1 Tax=Tiliqua scincoides TaxID=71010 RepID=UPI0034627337